MVAYSFSSQATMHDFLEILDARLRSKPSHGNPRGWDCCGPQGFTLILARKPETYKKWSKFSAFCCFKIWVIVSQVNSYMRFPYKQLDLLNVYCHQKCHNSHPYQLLDQQTFHLDCPWIFLVNLTHGINASAVLCGTKTTRFPPLHH